MAATSEQIATLIAQGNEKDSVINTYKSIVENLMQIKQESEFELQRQITALENHVTTLEQERVQYMQHPPVVQENN